MKIALAQLNAVVGDIAANAERIGLAIDRARRAGAELVVFPELAVIGYPPKDLLLKPAVVQQCARAIDTLAARCTGITALIGHPHPAGDTAGRLPHNAAAVCRDGRVAQHCIKTLLPTYDVFDEHRYFEPGRQTALTDLHGLKLGVTICEDLWNDPHLLPRRPYHEDPVAALAGAGAQVLVNCSASPFVVGKHAFRLELIRSAARRHGLPLLFCNQVGGNDELIFDGQSCAVDPDGRVLAHAKSFEEDLLFVDLPLGPAEKTPPPPATQPDAPATAGDVVWNRIERTPTGIASAYHGLVLGLRDYCRKCGFPSIVLGLSGGIDSAVTAALAVAALGAPNVTGVAMPSRYSSEGSLRDASDLADRLGIRLLTLPIGPVHEAFEYALAPAFAGREPDTTEENIQARVRGVVLMAMSNKFGSLLVTTGNKSEMAVGYCTLYGDMAGGLAVLSDVPKTMVWQLARWINDDPASPLRRQFNQPVIPPSSITKPPSAELRPDQTDQDALPPYELLDQIIERYVELEQSTAQIIEELAPLSSQEQPPQEGQPTADTPHDLAAIVRRVVQLIDRNEYKRRQAAPGLKITGRAFGFGRRMPIAQRYREQQPPR